EYLGFALADQVIGTMSYVQNVLVRPASSVRPYQGRVVDAGTAVNELAVDFVLTGNFLKEADIVRLNVELVDVNTNDLLWREGIEVEFENAFQLQDIVAQNVLRRLNVTFTQEERTRLQPAVPADPLAYEYYLRSLSYPLTQDGNLLAIAMLENALALDSTYAPAFVELGFRNQQFATFHASEKERMLRAEKAYRDALELNGELLSALSNLSALYTELGEGDQAVELLQRALAINPNSAESRFFLGYVYRYGGCGEEAVREMEAALALDPGNRRFRSIGLTYVYGGDLEKALDGIALDSLSAFGLAWLGQINLRMNHREIAHEYFDRAIEIEPESIVGLWAAAMRASLTNDRAGGLASLTIAASNVAGRMRSYLLANTFGLLGDAASAVPLLDNAVEGGFVNYPFMQRDEFLDPIRDDPSVQAILDRARVAHAAFKARFCSSDA